MLFLTAITAFISEYLDSALGMGYGTALAPILLLLGYQPAAVVPAILVSQLATDIATCICHHRCANVNLQIRSSDFKIALCIGLVSCLGAVVSVLIAVKVPQKLLAYYIGFLVMTMGLLILVTAGRKFRLSWGKIVGLSFLASFNKGISGGGYGPLVMGGQILSGVNAKNAVGITAFAEALTCLVGFVVYLLLGKAIDWTLVVILLVSAVPAVPVAAASIRRIVPERLRGYVGALIVILGALTFFRMTAKP